MKRTFINNTIKILGISAALALGACERMEILPPPELVVDPGNGSGGEQGEQSGNGNSDAQSMLFVNNDLDTKFVNPESASTWVSSSYASSYFNNESFARVDEAQPTKQALDILPTLKYEQIMDLQPAVGNLEESSFPGAFGQEVQPEWHVGSNWWVLEPQNVDYGYDPATVTKVEGAITENTTWTKDKKYLLKGQVFVRNGATLTIEPGTVIFGKKSTGIESGVLCINRGGKLIADGTPEEPIVFTGTAAMGERTRGQWGGVMFLGNGITNKGEDVLVEGIQGSDGEDGLYGGTDNNDSSGSMSYVRVEYAGISVGPGNELNSITMGGIGSGTELHHIIVTYAGDDAYEWFGGNVDLKYAVSFNCLDDDMDMDAGYSGTVQYAYLVRNPYAADESGASCFEISSSKSEGAMPQTSAIISNATVVGPQHILEGTEGLVMDPKFRGGLNSSKDAKALIQNSVIVGCPVAVENP